MSSDEPPSSPSFPFQVTAKPTSPFSPITRSQTSPSPKNSPSQHSSPFALRSSPRLARATKQTGNPAAPFHPPGPKPTTKEEEEEAKKERKRRLDLSAAASAAAVENATHVEGGEDGDEDNPDDDENPDDDGPPPNPTSKQCLCGKSHATRQPSWIAAEHIRFASLFSKASLTSTVQRLFRLARQQELDDRNLPPVWEVFAQEFNDPTCRVQILEPLDETWDSIHYTGHNPNILVHTRSAEQLKFVYTRKRASLTILCANYEKSGFNEGERFQYLNSVKNEKADASLYYWWLAIESLQLKSAVVKKLDEGVGGASSLPQQKKKVTVKKEVGAPSNADVAIVEACNAHRDFVNQQTRQAQLEQDAQHARETKEREDIKIVSLIASNSDMDPTVRAKANERLLAWLG
ncbi:hypothetical protein CYMTET_3645 [Cymbomonas tetramitiformis]|uniref:Uncharacterized protein n=1 Tax=Cymbomonas tetramitiformis TaxID=36881 RepID=A0AAE0H4N5_9CHLO|nr:hypothetical protein CYMTET_3645 [Cymbomonas tetramitiformis]